MTTTKKRPRYVQPSVPVADRLRWSIGEAASMVGRAESSVRKLERLGLFPPRVPATPGTDNPDKPQFVAAEVRAWSEGRDWRAMVASRTGAANAS